MDEITVTMTRAQAERVMATFSGHTQNTGRSDWEIHELFKKALTSRAPEPEPAMKTRFGLRATVRKSGDTRIATVEEIRCNPAAETLYSIQYGRDFAARVWAKESELEAA